MAKRYNNYHKHTHYSNLRTLDCVVKPEDYIKRAVELGHTTYFTGEHGFQGNLFESQTLCEKYGIKPIYSLEAYYVDDILNKEDRRAYHIVLVGMTEKARYEINKIMSIANTDGFYYKPRIGMNELLSLTPTDTIVTTACIASRLSDMLVRDDKGRFVDFGDPTAQKEVLDNFLYPLMKHFGKNLYLEVQNHKDLKQVMYNKMILALHNKFEIPLIHANDSHYILEGDSYYRDMFLRAKGIVYEEEDGFILDYPDYDTILERYKKQGVLTEEQAREALDNTLIFDNAEPIYTDKEFKIPSIPNEYIQSELHNPNLTNEDGFGILKEIVLKSWSVKKGTVKAKRIPEYLNAIKYELDIIKRCGMANYFTLDHFVVKRAVEKYGAVLTRSGRGSAVSFLVNNILGLTEVDRIKAPTKLYPTRFMSAERILASRSLPDIDLNFADVTPVIRATKDILGEDNIYYMVAYKPLQRSSAFRLWCKARGFEIDTYDEVAKSLADKTYTDEMFVEEHKKWEREFEYSKIFRGVIESVAPSPCSFLLSNDPISEKIGLIKVGNEVCCALDGYNCDVYKFLKNDYLTVSVYGIIDETYKLIGRPIDDIATLVNSCDDRVWDVYEKGLTTTINQADSDFGKQTVMRYKPKNLAELSAWVAAIRPGFASLLNTFLDRLPYSTGVEELDKLLESSFHFMMYQESIMAYLVWLGMEEKGTYDIIKKIAKKKFKESELNELKEDLKKGWIENVGTEDGFDDTWKVVEDAARYSFNASHALSVAIDSLYGAYLKSHYPLEYFTVALTMYEGDMARTANLIDELKYFGIKLNDIKFGKSSSKYMMDKDTNSIYKSVSSVKNCNEKIADELLELSNNKYNNFLELLDDINENTSVNSKQLTILITLNFFSEFGNNKYLLDIVDIYNKFRKCKIIKKNKMKSLGITEYIMKKFSEKESEKQYSQIDNMGLIDYLTSSLKDTSLGVQEQISSEMEYLEYPVFTNPNIKDCFYIAIAFKTYKEPRKPYLTLYNLNTGESVKTKIKSVKVFERDPFGLYSIIRVNEFTMEHKVKKIGDEWVKTDELEPILTDYEVIKK